MLKGRYSLFLQLVSLIQFGKGLGNISIVIPECVVQIEEDVLVIFQG